MVMMIHIMMMTTGMAKMTTTAAIMLMTINQGHIPMTAMMIKRTKMTSTTTVVLTTITTVMTKMMTDDAALHQLLASPPPPPSAFLKPKNRTITTATSVETMHIRAAGGKAPSTRSGSIRSDTEWLGG